MHDALNVTEHNQGLGFIDITWLQSGANKPQNRDKTLKSHIYFYLTQLRSHSWPTGAHRHQIDRFLLTQVITIVISDWS